MTSLSTYSLSGAAAPSARMGKRAFVRLLLSAALAGAVSAPALARDLVPAPRRRHR